MHQTEPDTPLRTPRCARIVISMLATVVLLVGAVLLVGIATLSVALTGSLAGAGILVLPLLVMLRVGFNVVSVFHADQAHLAWIRGIPTLLLGGGCLCVMLLTVLSD